MYIRDGVELDEEKEGEGIVLWIDRNNIMYDGKWYAVKKVHKNGRIDVFMHLWDGEQTIRHRALLSPLVANLSQRPAPNSLADFSAEELLAELKARG